jgi:hypothetical protein
VRNLEPGSQIIRFRRCYSGRRLYAEGRALQIFPLTSEKRRPNLSFCRLRAETAFAAGGGSGGGSGAGGGAGGAGGHGGSTGSAAPTSSGTVGTGTPTTGSAAGTPNAGKAGAGLNGVNGIPTGPANAAGQNNAGNNPSGANLSPPSKYRHGGLRKSFSLTAARIIPGGSRRDSKRSLARRF